MVEKLKQDMVEAMKNKEKERLQQATKKTHEQFMELFKENIKQKGV